MSEELFGEVLRLTIGSRLAVELVLNGLWPRGLRHGAEDVGRTAVGRCLAFLGILGTVCVCPQHPRIGMSQRTMDRTVSSSSSEEEERANSPQ